MVRAGARVEVRVRVRGWGFRVRLGAAWERTAKRRASCWLSAAARWSPCAACARPRLRWPMYLVRVGIRVGVRVGVSLTLTRPRLRWPMYLEC